MLAQQIKRLASQSLIYGLGGLISRFLSLLLLPLYTSYLHGRDYGRVETLTALTAVLVVVLRLGISSAFFRYYFDSTDWEHRVRVVRTSFWFTMGSATFGLAAAWIAAEPIAHALSLGHGQAWLVRAAFLGLWAQLDYEQLTALFRVEERPLPFTAAANPQLGVTGPAAGLPVGHYPPRPGGGLLGYVLTYVLFVPCWASLALAVLAPWLVRLLTGRPEFYEGYRVVGMLSFSAVAWGAYTVVAIGIGRARFTQFNWVVTGAAAGINIGLCFALVPPYGMIGAAVATVVSMAAMFGLMAVHAQRVYPVPYQRWRVGVGG